MGYDFGIVKCDIDYYIGFIDCEIWLLVLDGMDGKNWKGMEDFGRRREEVESGGGWRCGVLVEGGVIATNAFRLMCAYIAIF